MYNDPYQPLIPPPPPGYDDPEELVQTHINLPQPQLRHYPIKALLIGTTILLLILALWIVPFALAESQAAAIHSISRTSTTIQPISTTPALPWHLLVTLPTATPTIQPTDVPTTTTAPNSGTQQSIATQAVQPSPITTSAPVATQVPMPSPTTVPTQEPTPSPTATQVPTAIPTPSPTVEPSQIATPSATVASSPTDTPTTSAPTSTKGR